MRILFLTLVFFSQLTLVTAQETAFYPMPKGLRDFQMAAEDLQGNEILITETIKETFKKDGVERVIILDFTLQPKNEKNDKIPHSFHIYAYPEITSEVSEKLLKKLQKLKLTSPQSYPIEGALLIQLNQAPASLSQNISLPAGPVIEHSLETWTQNWFLPFLTAYYQENIAHSENQNLLAGKLQNVNWQYFSDLPEKLTHDESFWLSLLENNTHVYPLLFLSASYAALGNAQKASEVLELTLLLDNLTENESFFVQTLEQHINHQVYPTQQQMEDLWLLYQEKGAAPYLTALSDTIKNSPEFVVLEATLNNTPVDTLLLNEKTFYPYLYLSPINLTGFEQQYFTEKSVELLHAPTLSPHALMACYFKIDQPVLGTLSAALLWRTQTTDIATQTAVYAGLSLLEMNTLTFYFSPEVKKKSKDYLLGIEKLEMEQFEKEN